MRARGITGIALRVEKCAEEREGWCQDTRNALRAQRMALSGQGMVPSARGIVKRNVMDISEYAREGEERDKNRRRATQSNDTPRHATTRLVRTRLVRIKEGKL